MRTLTLIDGNNMMCRACFAPAPPLTSARGEPTKGPYIFLQTLVKLLRTFPTDYLVIALDSPRHSLRRRKIFAGYKVNRDERKSQKDDPDFGVQMALIRQLIEVLGLKTCHVEGFEADDIIATLAIKYEERCQVRIVSGDKDLHQLVSESIYVFDPFKWETFDQDAVRSRWGVDPVRVVEIQALQGDPTDGVPGVPGVGEKGARALVEEFGSALNAYKQRQCAGRARKALEKTSAEHIETMLDLVTLDPCVRTGLKLKDLAFHGLDLDRARPFLNYLGIKRWKKL